MPGTRLVEWLLARFTTADRAEAILGDLLETARRRGRIWFYLSSMHVLLTHAWRTPVAWIGAYGVGALLVCQMMIHDATWSNIGFKWAADYPNSPIKDAIQMVLMAAPIPLWFIAPFSLLRFGLRDRFSQLAGAMGAIVTVGIPLIRVSEFLILFAGLIGAIVVAGLISRTWRRPVITLIVATGTVFAVAGGTIWLHSLVRDQYPDWSPRTLWVEAQVAFLVAFCALIAICTFLHAMQRRSRRVFVSTLVVLSSLSGATLAWANGSNESFAVVDVHSSPYSLNPEVRGGTKGDRYILRDATMLDMIATAYEIDPDHVVGGPSWLDWDRFDVIAKGPLDASDERADEMLSSMLRDRFKLVTHNETRPMPAFALTLGKEKLKLKPGDPMAPNKCNPVPQDTTAGPALYVEMSCVNQTVDQILQDLHGMAGAYVTNPVVDRTGLKGVWDFDIKWTAKNQLVREGTDGISFFDAVEKQLGLHLEPATAPLPVLIVDSVNEKPTPNAPDIDKMLPQQPPGEFEVSVIRPSKPDTQPNGDMSRDQVKFQGFTLEEVVRAVWDLPDDGPTLQGVPDWARKDKWDFLAKAAKAPGDPALDEDDLRVMVQKLLADRFKLVVHTENIPLDAYDLVAVTPRLAKADPAERTKCFPGPAPGGKDPRIDHPELNKLRTCQDITMAQFVSTLQSVVPGYIKTPVLDKTGLNGAYDFTLNYSGAGKLKNPTATVEGDAAAAPSGALSFFDALEKELGLKLQPVKRPIPVLVIDHVEKPSEN